MCLSQRTCGCKCGIFQLCVDSITKEQQNRGKLLSFACRRSFRRCSTRGKLSHFPSLAGRWRLRLMSHLRFYGAILSHEGATLSQSRTEQKQSCSTAKNSLTRRVTLAISLARYNSREKISGVTSVLDSLLWSAEQTPTSHSSDRRQDANQHSVGPRTPSYSTQESASRHVASSRAGLTLMV